MRLPRWMLLCLAAASVPAAAGSPEGFALEPLPADLAPHASQVPHVPTPMPSDGDLQFKQEGPGGWVVAAGVLAGGASAAGLVAAVDHGRAKKAEEPADAERLRKARNVAGYTALGLVGGAGVCIVINSVW